MHPRQPFRFDSAGRSHPGLVRDHNEDCAYAGQSLVAVADGVGGSVCGEVASEVVIGSIAHLEDDPPSDAPGDGMVAVAGEASAALVQAVAADPARQGMATTLTALRLDGGSLAVLNVGDSRAYRLRQGRWTRLTRDDSLVQDLIDAGAISEAEALRHPARGVVLQALNGGPVEPRISVQDVAEGDRYLVCSDGLTDYVAEAEVAGIVADQLDPATCCAALIEATLDAGAPDNVTCIVADVRPAAP